MLIFILGTYLFSQRVLPKIQVRLLQYPRDPRVPSDFLSIYRCPISRESCPKWIYFHAIQYQFATNRVDPFKSLPSERCRFSSFRLASLTVSRYYQVSPKCSPTLEGQRRAVHVNIHDLAPSKDSDTKLPCQRLHRLMQMSPVNHIV